MGFKIYGGAVCALALSAAAALASPVNLIQNGSFEQSSPTVPTLGLVNNQTFAQLDTQNPGWDVFKELPFWRSGVNAQGTSTDSGIEVQNNRAIGTIDAKDGKHYIELDSDDDYGGITGSSGLTTNSEARQTVSLLGGRDYVFSFAYSPRTSTPADNGITFSIGSFLAGSIANTLTSNASVQSLIASPTTVGAWSIATMTFKAVTGGPADVLFKATGSANELGGFLDDVKLHLVPVPVPAGLVLAMTGLGLAAALRRRRTAAAA
jgi:hypothetical protein